MKPENPMPRLQNEIKTRLAKAYELVQSSGQDMEMIDLPTSDEIKKVRRQLSYLLQTL